ncbi:MAG: MgtC/SapB family protein [Cellulosilyticaceae bacterium]
MEILQDVNIISTFIRLLLALICGGILGIERGRKNRPAGFRTYMIVCIGATMVMITNQYIAQMYHVGDPTRMGAQVISGIGFLGAGTIIVTGRNRVKGLTTAAGLWASACIGLTIGIGYYEGAILGCLMIYIAMSMLHGIGGRVTHHSSELNLYIEFESLSDIGIFLEHLRSIQIKVLDIEMIKSNEVEEAVIAGLFTLKAEKGSTHESVVKKLLELDGVKAIEEY